MTTKREGKGPRFAKQAAKPVTRFLAPCEHLPKDARDLLIKASESPAAHRTRAIDAAVQQIQSKYPHLFKE